MSNTKFITILTFILLIIIVGLGLFVFLDDRSMNDEDSVKPEIISLSVEKPNLVVVGKNLNKVELYTVSTDEEGNLKNPVLWGEAKPDLGGGENDIWNFPIPTEPIFINEIYALGYDSNNESIGKVSLNITGTSALYNALWSSAKSILLPLKIGQTGTFEYLTIKVEKLIMDNRCPVGAQCIQAGDVSFEVRLISDVVEDLIEIKESDDAHSFGDFFVDIVKISPVPALGSNIEKSDYIVTFSVAKNIKP